MTLIRIGLKIILVFLILNGLARANSFLQASPFEERLTISSDRDIYIAGEEVFVCINLLNGMAEKQSHSEVAYIILRNENQTVIYHTTIVIKEMIGATIINLPDTLSTGYYQLVAFTNYMRGFGEDFFTTKQLIVANRFDEYFLNLHSEDKNEESYTDGYQRPNSNYVRISFDKHDYKVQEHASFSIIPLNGNKIKSYTASISAFESLIDQERTSDQDKPTGSISQPISKDYYMEVDGTFLSGELKRKLDGQPIANARVLLSTPDSVVNLKYVRTDSFGRFHFHLSHVYQGKKLIILPDSTTIGEEFVLTIDDKFSLNKPFIAKRIAISDQLIDYIKRSQEIVRIQKAFTYGKSFSGKFRNGRQIDLPRVFSSASYGVNLSDYELLTDLSEISRELIPYLRVRRRGEDYSVRVHNGQTSYNFFQDAPAVFLNGVLMEGITSFAEFGSDKISKIELVNLPWRFGELLFNGIVSVHLKPDVPVEPHFSKNSKVILLDSLANWPKYRIPKEVLNSQLSSSKYPDFRQLLFWGAYAQSEIFGENRINFTTSHLKGEYVVVVEGVTINGEAFREIKLIDVR